jgi:hypothetical protein
MSVHCHKTGRLREPERQKNIRHRTIADDVILQPWFLPQRVAFAIQSLVPRDFWRKMRNVFDDYGCIVCGTESNYHSNGMCALCFNRTRRKIRLSARRHAVRGRKPRLDLELFRQERLARKLLARFAAASSTAPKKRRLQVIPHNPVYEALAARLEQSRKPK